MISHIVNDIIIVAIIIFVAPWLYKRMMMRIKNIVKEELRLVVNELALKSLRDNVSSDRYNECYKDKGDKNG